MTTQPPEERPSPQPHPADVAKIEALILNLQHIRWVARAQRRNLHLHAPFAELQTEQNRLSEALLNALRPTLILSTSPSKYRHLQRSVILEDAADSLAAQGFSYVFEILERIKLDVNKNVIGLVSKVVKRRIIKELKKDLQGRGEPIPKPSPKPKPPSTETEPPSRPVTCSLDELKANGIEPRNSLDQELEVIVQHHIWWQEVRAYLAQLPDPKDETIGLLTARGFKSPQIAKELGPTWNSDKVRKRQERLRKLLRQRFPHYFGQD